MSNFLPSHLLSFFFSKYLCLLVFIRGFFYPLFSFLFPLSSTEDQVLATEWYEKVSPMRIAAFRFYEELNDFLPNNRKKVDFEAKLNGKKSIKKIIEEFGVPPEAVDLILVNGKSVDFNYIIKDRDRVSVYPVFERLNIQNVTQLRRVPLRRIQFIADSHLDKLVNPMQILGFDIDFNGSYTTQDIIEKSIQEKRIILTTRKELKRSKLVTHCILLRPGTTRNQIKYVMQYLDLKSIPS